VLVGDLTKHDAMVDFGQTKFYLGSCEYCRAPLAWIRPDSGYIGAVWIESGETNPYGCQKCVEFEEMESAFSAIAHCSLGC